MVRPGSTAEVAGVDAGLRELGVALVPQGGNTGLVGGGVPLHGEVVLSLRQPGRSWSRVDAGAGQVTAGAGVALSALCRPASAAGWAYGSTWPAATRRPSGAWSPPTPAGTRVLRYGDTRAQLLGMEAVLGTGAVVSHLGGLVKDNTGYHLPGLLCGSEGTLAVVTAARLRLVPRPGAPDGGHAGLRHGDPGTRCIGGPATVAADARSLRALLLPGLELVCSVTGLSPPFPASHPAYLLVEAADQLDPTPALAEATDGSLDLDDVVVADRSGAPGPAVALPRGAHRGHQHARAPPQARRDPAVRRAGGIHRPGPRRVWQRIVPGARTWLFGHAGDGNVHVNVTGLSS